MSRAGTRLVDLQRELADIPIAFADWQLAVPYGVERSGTLEVLLGLIQGAGNRA